MLGLAFAILNVLFVLRHNNVSLELLILIIYELSHGLR
jgi:hypothetical protein